MALAYSSQAKKNAYQRDYRRRVREENPAYWEKWLQKKQLEERERRGRIAAEHSVDPNIARERKREIHFRFKPSPSDALDEILQVIYPSGRWRWESWQSLETFEARMRSLIQLSLDVKKARKYAKALAEALAESGAEPSLEVRGEMEEELEACA